MKTLAQNRRASFDYEILEKFTAGIELSGHEAKSIRTKGASLQGAYIIMRNNEAWLLGADIPSFQPGNAPEGYDPQRTRRLLLNKKELNYLLGKTQSGLTLVPIKAYDNPRGLVKLEIALARGRKKHDKRELLKKKESEKEIRRARG